MRKTEDRTVRTIRYRLAEAEQEVRIGVRGRPFRTQTVLVEHEALGTGSQLRLARVIVDGPEVDEAGEPNPRGYRGHWGWHSRAGAGGSWPPAGAPEAALDAVVSAAGGDVAGARRARRPGNPDDRRVETLQTSGGVL